MAGGAARGGSLSHTSAGGRARMGRRHPPPLRVRHGAVAAPRPAPRPAGVLASPPPPPRPLPAAAECRAHCGMSHPFPESQIAFAGARHRAPRSSGGGGGAPALPFPPAGPRGGPPVRRTLPRALRWLTAADLRSPQCTLPWPGRSRGRYTPSAMPRPTIPVWASTPMAWRPQSQSAVPAPAGRRVTRMGSQMLVNARWHCSQLLAIACSLQTLRRLLRLRIPRS